MHLSLLLQLMMLLTAANGAPVLATRVLHQRGDFPLDAHLRWTDGRPLFGASKTLRGIVVSLFTTILLAPLIGLPWTVGALVGALAMVGDLVSSFTKRRLNLAPGSRATGIDQVPESLLPLVAARAMLPLSIVDVLLGVAMFFVGEIVLSRLLYRWHLRDRPY